MSSEKSSAIVLRLVEFSETSVIATLFTEDFGKVSALAKGARRPKGPFEAALDLLAVCRIVFIHKSSDALDLLTEAKLERRFRAASRNLSCLYAGYYVAELLQELTDEGDPHPRLFQAANQTLIELDGDCDPARSILRFEMIALHELGHLPSFEQCVGCGNTLVLEGRVAFGLLAGGVLCEQCRRGQRQVVSVNSKVIEAFRCFADPNDSHERNELDRGLRGELRGVLNRYLANLLGKQPRMHRYLGMLSN